MVWPPAALPVTHVDTSETVLAATDNAQAQAINDLVAHVVALEAASLSPIVAYSYLARGECTTQQNTNTTVIDVPGCSIAFTVGARPVWVRGRLPLIFSSQADNTLSGSITDVANAIKDQDFFTSTSVGALGNFGSIILEEWLTVPGVYTRKLRFSGTNATANSAVLNYLAASKASIVALQV